MNNIPRDLLLAFAKSALGELGALSVRSIAKSVQLNSVPVAYRWTMGVDSLGNYVMNDFRTTQGWIGIPNLIPTPDQASVIAEYHVYQDQRGTFYAQSTVGWSVWNPPRGWQPV
jgi:hypothetical protein